MPIEREEDGAVGAQGAWLEHELQPLRAKRLIARPDIAQLLEAVPGAARPSHKAIWARVRWASIYLSPHQFSPCRGLQGHTLTLSFEVGARSCLATCSAAPRSWQSPASSPSSTLEPPAAPRAAPESKSTVPTKSAGFVANPALCWGKVQSAKCGVWRRGEKPWV